MPVTKVCSFTASLERAKYLKDYIENKDGYKMFYHNNTTYKREKDIHFLYGLTWYKTPFDVNKEVNNGRGAVDFKVSHGSTDQTLIEFKLASNTHIKRNLEKQTQIYLKANKGAKKVIVIVVLNESEAKKMNKILTDLKLHGKKNIVLIDARKDNKASASAA
jgi:hypothetical protein